jgi:large subunit ribosomal protein L23
MDKFKYRPIGMKAIRLLEKRQYTFDVDVKATKTEVKRWIEGFFSVKVIGMNSHRPPKKKKRIGSIIGYPVKYKRMIVTLKSGYSIPFSSL